MPPFSPRAVLNKCTTVQPSLDVPYSRRAHDSSTIAWSSPAATYTCLSGMQLLKEDDNNWPPPDRIGRQELEIILGDQHISFTTTKLGSLAQVTQSKDPEGLKLFYYLVQVRTCRLWHSPAVRLLWQAPLHCRTPPMEAWPTLALFSRSLPDWYSAFFLLSAPVVTAVCVCHRT